MGPATWRRPAVFQRSYFHRAIAKYGDGAFRIEAIASCLAREHSGDVEREVIRRLRPIYNQTNGGEVTIGRKVTAEVRERMRALMTGRRLSEEQVEKMRASGKARWQTDAAFREMALSAGARGRASVDEGKRIKAVAESARNRVWSAESRARLSASCQGRVHGQDVIERIREKKQKPVVCIERNEVFRSMSEAAAATGISVTSVSRICLGKRTRANGLTFRCIKTIEGESADGQLSGSNERF